MQGAFRLGVGPLVVGLWLGVVGGGAPPGFAAQVEVEDALARLATSANGQLRVKRSDDNGLVSFLSVHGGPGIPVEAAASATAEERARAFLDRHGRAFGILRAADTRTLRVSDVDAVGVQHVRLQQTHAGLRVTGAELIVHLRDTHVVAANGRMVDGASLASVETVPTITADQVASKARELVVRERKAVPLGVSSPALELLSRDLLEGRSGPTRLAWFLKLRASGVLEYVWIDARTGEALLHFNQRPDARDRQVHTAGQAYVLPGTLVRGEGAPPSGDADVDAGYDFAGDTYDFFWTHFGRDSIDGAGQPLVLTVHYGSAYQNAFWDPSSEQLGFGDGATVDDVVGHEVTHGLTQHTADLFYYKQSGALNEAISDVFGETVDLSNGVGDDSPPARWLAGEDWTGVGPIRDMMNPNAFGNPGKLSDPLLHCGSGDEGGVHTNSGILNHAYALAVDGGTYNGQTITGIGLVKASAVVYRTLTAYLTTTSTYADADSALRQSCQDLIGSSVQASDCEDFGRALDAVEMGQPWPCVLPITVTKQGNATGTVTSNPPGIDCGPTCQAPFDLDTLVSLKATPDAGAVFSGWGGACKGRSDCYILSSSSRSVTAAFDRSGTTYPVVVTLSGTGTVTSSPEGILCGIGECAKEFLAGSEVTLTASAPAGWGHAWGGDCRGHSATCKVVINGPKNITAVFVEAAFTKASAFQSSEYGFEAGRPAWGDYDGDGDLDLAVTGLSQYTERTRLYRNDGGALVDAGIPLIQVYGFAAWGDYDNDGDLDLVVGGEDGLSTCAIQLYRNDSGTLTPVPTPLVAVSGAAAWGDYDNDGDLDLVIAGHPFNGPAITKLYRNDHGTFADSGTPLTATVAGDVAWGDYDRDGDLDLVVGGVSAAGPVTVLYRNDHGFLTDSRASLPGTMFESVAWADYDGDGDLDLALTGRFTLKLFRNDGGVLVDSGFQVDFAGSLDYAYVSWGDYDGDGDPDLLVTGSPYPAPLTRLYRNDGTALTDVFVGLQDVSAGAAWGDYDNDGRLDVVLLGTFGPFAGGSYLDIFRNTTPATNAPPQAPAAPVATAGWDGVVLEWTPGSDGQTPAAALSYNVRVGTTAGGSEVVSAMADGATGHRRVVAPGNAGESTRLVLKGLPPGQYDWAVQTIDSSFKGSVFTQGPPFAVVAPKLSFHTVTPCRVLDTRDPTGAHGGPALEAGQVRVFPVSGRCGIPATARVVSVNLTVTEPTKGGHLTVYRGDGPASSTSSINYSAGQTRANNAVLPLSGAGEMAVQCGQADGSAHFILDVNGYFE